MGNAVRCGVWGEALDAAAKHYPTVGGVQTRRVIFFNIAPAGVLIACYVFASRLEKRVL